MQPVRRVAELEGTLRERRRRGVNGVPDFGLALADGGRRVDEEDIAAPRRWGAKAPRLSERDDARLENHRAEQEQEPEEDLKTYFAKLVRQQVRLSGTVHRTLLNEFDKSSLSQQLQMISSLEEETNAPPLSDPIGKQARTLQEEAFEAKDTEEDMTREEIDAAWEDLIEESLPLEKRKLIRQQYYSIVSTEQRFHMLLEFSSFLRPLSEAQLRFQEAANERMDSGGPWPFSEAKAASRWAPQSYYPAFGLAFVTAFAVRFLI